MKNIMEEFNDSSGQCPRQCRMIKYDEHLAKYNSMELIHSELEKYGLVGYFRNESLHVFITEADDHNPYIDGEFNPLHDYKKARLKRMSIIHLNFKDVEQSVLTQDTKITPAFLIGNIGGFVGVFLGYSFVTFVDMVIGFTRKLASRI